MWSYFIANRVAIVFVTLTCNTHDVVKNSYTSLLKHLLLEDTLNLPFGCLPKRSIISQLILNLIELINHRVHGFKLGLDKCV